MIDFGDFSTDIHAPTILTFADSSQMVWNDDAILLVKNWRGTVVTGDGNDQLVFGNIFGTLTEKQLSQIVFEGYGPLFQLPDGEVVPVPEPSTYAFGGFLVLLVAGHRYRRQLTAFYARVSGR